MVALKHIKSKAVSLQAFAPDVSSATAFVINRMLQKDPDARYQTYAELVEHLTYARNKLLGEIGGAYKPRSHVTLESESQQSLMAWIVLIVLVLLAAGGTGLFVFREKIFKKEESRGATAGQAVQPAIAEVNVEERYAQARKLLCGGDYEKADRIFAEMASRPNLPQPLGRWILLHQGMAALLARNTGEARQAFKRLQQRGMFSLDPSDKALSNLFIETGRLLSENNPVSADFAKTYNSGDCEAVALFLFALNDWQLSQFDDAGALFQAFINSDPEPPFQWISDYKPIARKYLEDFAVYRKISAKAAGAATLEARTGVLAELARIKSPPLLPGKLPEKLQQLQDDLTQAITREKSAADQKRTFELTVEHERQSRILSDAKAKFLKWVEGMQYDEARVAIQGVQVTFPDLENEKTALLKKSQWLQGFKTTLMSDLSGSGYPQPVVKRTGATISGVAHKATKSQIEIQTPYGNVVVLWQEMSPATLLSMADYFTLRNTQPDAIADRCWLSGVYAFQNGLQKQGVALLNKAAEKKVEYRDLLPLFVESPAQ